MFNEKDGRRCWQTIPRHAPPQGKNMRTIDKLALTMLMTFLSSCSHEVKSSVPSDLEMLPKTEIWTSEEKAIGDRIVGFWTQKGQSRHSTLAFSHDGDGNERFEPMSGAPDLDDRPFKWIISSEDEITVVHVVRDEESGEGALKHVTYLVSYDSTKKATELSAKPEEGVDPRYVSILIRR
jgi:hypothetical protein